MFVFYGFYSTRSRGEDSASQRMAYHRLQSSDKWPSNYQFVINYRPLIIISYKSSFTFRQFAFESLWCDRCSITNSQWSFRAEPKGKAVSDDLAKYVLMYLGFHILNDVWGLDYRPTRRLADPPYGSAFGIGISLDWDVHKICWWPRTVIRIISAHVFVRERNMIKQRLALRRHMYKRRLKTNYRRGEEGATRKFLQLQFWRKILTHHSLQTSNSGIPCNNTQPSRNQTFQRSLNREYSR